MDSADIAGLCSKGSVVDCTVLSGLLAQAERSSTVKIQINCRFMGLNWVPLIQPAIIRQFNVKMYDNRPAYIHAGLLFIVEVYSENLNFVWKRKDDINSDIQSYRFRRLHGWYHRPADHLASVFLTLYDIESGHYSR